MVDVPVAERARAVLRIAGALAEAAGMGQDRPDRGAAAADRERQ